tara:strand:+ start:1890 stop:2087 length:198 start_codon:yes stop_codon:yes gene_type:complete
MNKNYKYYNQIIKKIENTRKKNNKNWMDLLRLGFKHNPNQAKIILKGIFKEDKRVSNLVNKLIKK